MYAYRWRKCHAAQIAQTATVAYHTTNKDAIDVCITCRSWHLFGTYSFHTFVTESKIAGKLPKHTCDLITELKELYVTL